MSALQRRRIVHASDDRSRSSILAFGEPLRWPLAVGTQLVVAGGIALAAEGERPVDYRAYGAALAVSVAVAFGLRDNVARAVTEDVAADPLAQTTAIMLGASLVLLANLLRLRSPTAAASGVRVRKLGRRHGARAGDALRGARPRARERRGSDRGHRGSLDRGVRRDLPRPRRARRQAAVRGRAARRCGQHARRRDALRSHLTLVPARSEAAPHPSRTPPSRAASAGASPPPRTAARPCPTRPGAARTRTRRRGRPRGDSA